ncbi:Ecd family [Trinorchestia longiramus]|nr:Ecd family [Trinorchestia longiramus]
MASYNDVIQYWLFPLGSDGSVVTSEAELKSYSQVYLTALLPHMETYIWNQDHFNLRVVKENVTHGLEGAVPNHLYGESCVGDYIEDEWYITYLLRELSSIFPQLVISAEPRVLLTRHIGVSQTLSQTLEFMCRIFCAVRCAQVRRYHSSLGNTLVLHNQYVA